MNAVTLPELRIDALFVVPRQFTARRLFRLLPHGRAYAHRLSDVFATGALVAVVESVCAEALQPHLDEDETVVGSRVEIQHLAPALTGSQLRLQGAATERRGRDILFDVEAHDALERVCRALVVLNTVRAPLIEARLARKGQRLSDARPGSSA